MFYKYTTVETAEIILNSGKLRWSSPVVFNGISEFKKMPIFKPSLDEDKPKYIKLLVEHVFEINRLDILKLSQPSLILINYTTPKSQHNFSKILIPS